MDRLFRPITFELPTIRIEENTMIKKCAIAAVCSVAFLCFGAFANAQFGGVQVQVGGMGTGVRVGGFGYGNGYYNNNGYGNAYGNRWNGYGSYAQPNGFYMNGGNNFGYGYRGYPAVSYGYGVPRYYAAPFRRYPARRFR
jgi:hypothetical protein